MKTNLILFLSFFLLFNCNNNDDDNKATVETEPETPLIEEYTENIIGSWELKRLTNIGGVTTFDSGEIIFTFNEETVTVVNTGEE